MAEPRPVPPDEQVRDLYERAESRTAAAFERLVASEAFGELLAWATENVIGLTKIGFDVADLAVRNLRLAGRADIARLGRSLARTEDKLERVLQEVEKLRDEVTGARPVAEIDKGRTKEDAR
jgi:hypothetical protein